MLNVSPLPQVVEHELERVLGLLDLLAAHAAGAIDDEDHRLGGAFVVVGLHLGAGQQQEEAVFAVVGAIAEEARAELAVGRVEEQAEVGRRHVVGRFELDDGVLVVRPLDVDRVRRAIDVLQLGRRFDRDVDRQLLDRLRGVFGRSKGE